MRKNLKELVRERYAEVAMAVGNVPVGAEVSCYGSACCPSEARASTVSFCGESYSAEELQELPQAAARASLGCGNLVALATLSPGEVVLDLGSGGGIDVLLSAKRVAPGGRAYGLDMTDEMLALSRQNQQKAGVENVEFLRGDIEDIPLPDSVVDVIISNCVINLSIDKPKVLGEAFRVLKPGGRFAVSDMVFLGDTSALVNQSVSKVELWAGCISGALAKSEYETLLAGVGFEDISVEVTQVYSPELIAGPEGAADVAGLEEVPFASAFIRARKPGAARSQEDL